ncbi:MAG: SRPBCC family protein [Acidimicrobiales bacterium]
MRVTTSLPAPPEEVWAYLRSISRHVEWMEDAVAIRFSTPETEGVGTTFETDTRVGPLRLVDKMVVIEWDAERTMGIRHTGMVTGTGRFTLAAEGPEGGGTRFTWEEELSFPWWMAGSLGGLAGAPVLRRIWRRNLENLRRHFA